MSEQQAQGADEAIDLSINELKARREKPAALREQGVVSPQRFPSCDHIRSTHAEFDTAGQR